MSVTAIRFRMEGALCVLQVSVKSDRDYYGDNRSETWRDAMATDLLEVAKFTADYSALEQRVEYLQSRVSDLAEPLRRD